MHGSRGQFEAESLFYSMCHVASHPSCLRVVCYYFPRPPTLYTVSAISRHSRLDDSKLSLFPGWAKQMMDFMMSQSPGTKHYVPTHNAIHISCLAYISQSINQSINQAIQTSIVPYFASESDANNCAQRPPTTRVSHAITACCKFNHPLIIGYGSSKVGYQIIRVSYPYTYL